MYIKIFLFKFVDFKNLFNLFKVIVLVFNKKKKKKQFNYDRFQYTTLGIYLYPPYHTNFNITFPK